MFWLRLVSSEAFFQMWWILGPDILNHHLGWTLSTVKSFPWHWPQYSGSLYHGAKKFQSVVSHCVVIGICVCWFYRQPFFSTASGRR